MTSLDTWCRDGWKQVSQGGRGIPIELIRGHTCRTAFSPVRVSEIKEKGDFETRAALTALHIYTTLDKQTKEKQTRWLLFRERTIPTERQPLVAEFLYKILQIEGCRVVRPTDPYGLILGFLGWSRYLLFQVAP
jgi:hypothetical protein